MSDQYSSLKEKIKQLAASHFADAVRYRRHIHERPELSFQEYETSAYVKSILDIYSIPYRSGVGNETGIVALLEGRQADKRIIALRADMDALPITEKNDLDYRSRNEGVMHACGHDVHTASLLATAGILSELRN